MQIFIDSANLEEIEKWLKYGIADGVTTNPSIMLKEGVRDLEAGVKRIARMIDERPMSVEVTTNDLKEMLDQARTFAGWAPNINVKIPVIDSSGRPLLDIIRTLEKEGIRVNTTVIMSFGQVALATKAGATYVSIFAGRVSDEGGDAVRLIRDARAWLDLWGYSARIIVGSIRQPIDIQEAALAGAHILTIPPQLLDKMVDHNFSRETVRRFIEDAGKAAWQIEREET